MAAPDRSPPRLSHPPAGAAGAAGAREPGTGGLSAAQAVQGYLTWLEGVAGSSGSLRRQRAWALREAVLFAAVCCDRDVTTREPLTPAERRSAEARVGGVGLGQLLDDAFLELWLAYADPVLRGVADPVVATQRARTASLRALAGFVGAERPGHRHGRPALRSVLTEPELAVAMVVLTGPLPDRGPDDHIRLAAMLAVMSARPMRSVELCAVRRDQVICRGSEVLLHVGHAAGSEEPVRLGGVAADRLRHWLEVRESFVSALQGGPVHALWTSIRSNSRPGPRGSLPLPPGMRLRPRGLQRAYARSVASANAHHHGRPGFPLPRSLDLLRRSLRQAPGRV